MGWKDAPVIEEATKGKPKWMDAPEVDAPQQQGGGDLMSTIMDAEAAFRSGANQGMTFGFGDEMYAGLTAPFRAIPGIFDGTGYDIGRAYEQGLGESRQGIAEEQARNPIAATVGDIAGSVVTGGQLAKGGMTLMNPAKVTVPGMAVRGAAEGAIYGGLSGAGRSEGNLEDRLKGAQDGAMWGGVTGGIGGAVAGKLAGNAAKAAIPTVDDLKAQAGALYDAAGAKGVTFARNEVKSVVDDIAAKVISEGIDPTLHPRATAALKRLQEAGATGMTVKDAQTMRRVIAAAAKDPMNPDEQRIASLMIQRFDDMVADKAPELAQARGIYHQAKKGELIEQTIELASSRANQYSQSGMENALRTEFRALQRKIIKGQLKGLSQAEIDAINKVADGGPVENILRFVGKAAPSGIVSAGMGGGVPFMIGNAVGGPAVGAAAAGTTMGAGLLGKAGAEAMTRNAAVRAALIARSGGQMPQAAINAPNREVLRALIAAGGNETGAIPSYIDRAKRPPVAPGKGVFPPVPFDYSKAVPPAVRTFVGTVAGSKARITEADFTKSELKVLENAVRNAERAGRDYVTYEDYDQSLAVNPKNGLPGDKILGGLFDTNKSMAGVIGRAKFRRLSDGTIEIVDQYDFENMSGYVLDDGGKMVSIPQTYKGDTMRLFSDTLGKSGLYQAIRVLGENAAPEGEGRNVKIKIAAGV